MSGDIKVGNLVAGLSMDTGGFTKGIENAAGALDGFKGTIEKVKTALITLMTNPVVLAAAAITAMVAAAKAAWDAWKEFDAAYDAILVGTGATEEALEGLKDSFDNVFANATYVESMDALAATIADLNTYLGVTGEQLEGLATQFSNLEGMGASASVADFSQALNKWGIEADKAGQYLDYFFKVSQDTGISIDTLTSSLASNKATLDLFGFSLEESASLIGAMNKAGFDSATLNTALRTMAANGITTRDAFDEVVSRIKNAKDESEAMSVAFAKFGARAGAEMVALIQGGLLDDIGGGFAEIDGHINQTADDTADFENRMDKFGRGFQEAFSKAGAFVEEFLMKLFDIFEWVESLSTKLFAPFQKLFEKIGASFSKFWNEGEDNTGNAIDNIAGFIEALVDKVAEWLDWFFETVYPTIEVVIQNIVSVIKVFAALFAGDWEAMWKNINDLTVRGAELLYTIMEFVWDKIAEGIEDVIQGIVDWIFDRVNDVLGFFASVANGAISMVNTVIGALNMIPGIDLQEVATVDWKVEAPEVALMRFADSGIGHGLRDYIDKGGFDYEAVASAFASSPVVVTVEGIADPYAVTVNNREKSVSAVRNPNGA